MKTDDFIISFTVGDRWGDGHGRYETIVVLSNVDEHELTKAYKAGKEIIGFDPTKFFIKEIGDVRYPWEKIKEVLDLPTAPKWYGSTNYTYEHFQEDLWLNPDSKQQEVAMYVGMWVRFWMVIAFMGNPDIKWKIPKKRWIDDGCYEFG